MPVSRADRLNSLAARANGDGFSRASSGASRHKPKFVVDHASARKGPKHQEATAMGFGRVSSAPKPSNPSEAGRPEESRADARAAEDLERMGIKIERESERSKLSIKQVLEQKRLNDATGALVKEFFASIPPEKLSSEISRMFHEFDTDHSGGLDQEEIGRAFELVGKPLKDSDVHAWLLEFDADGNGIIDEDEFGHMVRNRMGIPCAITCIPCLRGCSTTQRRAAKALPPMKSRALKRNATSIHASAASKPWEGEQLLPSIADRRREMMQNFLGRSDAQALEGAASENRSGAFNTFTRTSSAPGAVDASTASEKAQIEDIFRLVKRKSIANKVDHQWKGRALDQALEAANSLMDQINYFLVAHLKSVPLEKLGKKIKETFMRIDLDNSGELNKAEVGAAFERLGKPLSSQDLDAYMDSVDIDGNGVVDVHEFEHMTRKLLSVDCISSCACCRYLHEAGKEDNWGANKREALEISKQERVAQEAAQNPDSFTRVGSAPGTPIESDVAEEEALQRRAEKIKKDKKKKEAQYKAAMKAPSSRPKVMKKTLSGSSLARTDSNSSMTTDSPCSTSKDSPHDANSPLISKSATPSRVTSKLHDAISKSTPDQVRVM